MCFFFKSCLALIGMSQKIFYKFYYCNILTHLLKDLEMSLFTMMCKMIIKSSVMSRLYSCNWNIIGIKPNKQ